MRYLRLILWVVAFLVATFCWVVIIEHGPENFIAGSRIEIENLAELSSRFFK